MPPEGRPLGRNLMYAPRSRGSAAKSECRLWMFSEGSVYVATGPSSHLAFQTIHRKQKYPQNTCMVLWIILFSVVYCLQCLVATATSESLVGRLFMLIIMWLLIPIATCHSKQ